MGMVAETFVRARLTTAGLAGEFERDIGRIARGAGEKAGAEMSAGMKTALLGSLAVTAGVAAAFVASTKAAGNFEASMVKLTTTAGETGTMVSGNLKKVSAGILDLASTTGTSTKQLADGMYLVESAGFHGAEGLTVLKAAAQGARAEQANMATVTNAVTSALKSYNLGSDSSVSITNQMVAAVGHGKTTFEQFSGSLSTVLPLAAAAHISFAEVAGAVATMTNHGTSAAEATQQLAFTIRALQAPNTQAVKEMDRLGLSSVDVASHLGERGLTGTLQLLTEAIARKMGPQGLVMIDTLNKSATAAKDASIMINSMPPGLQKLAQGFLEGTVTVDQWHQGIKGIPASQAAMISQFATLVSHTTGFNDLLKKGGPAAQTMADAIKKMTGGANGLNTTLMLTGGNLTSFEGNVAAVAAAGQHAGKDIEGWGVIQETFNFKMSAFKGQLEAAGIALGQGLLPAVGKLVTVIGSVLGPIASWMTTHQRLSAIILESIGSIGALILLSYGLQAVIGFVKGATLLWTAATWLFNAAQSTMTVLMSRTLIMVVLYETWTKIIAVATKVWTVAQWALNIAMEAAGGPIGLIIIGIGLLIAAVIYAWTHFAWFRTVVIDTWHAIQVAIKFAWENIIKPVVNDMVTFWRVVLGPTVLWLWQNVFYPAWTSIRTIIQIAVIAIEIAIKIIVVTWQNVVAPALMVLWKFVFKPAWEGMQFVVQLAIGLMKNEIAGLVWFWQHVLSPALSTLGDLFKRIWHDMLDTFKSIWSGPGGIRPIFEDIMHWVTVSIPNAFRDGVNIIGGWWSTLKGWAAVPVSFIIDTVINKGIIDTINSVAKFFGVSGRVDHINNPLSGHSTSSPGGGRTFMAEGGHVRGPGTGTSDSIQAWLSNGEYVIPAKIVQQMGVGFFNNLIGRPHTKYPGDGSQGLSFAAGGLVGLITDPIGWIKDHVHLGDIADRFGGSPYVKAIAGAPAHLLTQFIDWAKSKVASLISGAGFSGPVGGPVGAVQQWIMAQAGKPYIWASAGPTGYDCSGIVSAAWNLLHGRNPYSHTFSTSDEAAYFPLSGPGMFTAGWANPGEAGGGSVGHTAANLAGLTFESRGSAGVVVGHGVTPLTNFAHLGHYAMGGIVPGAIGSPQLGVLHGGERVIPVNQQHPDESRLEALMEELIDVCSRIAPGVGAEINGLGRSIVRTARAT